MAFNILDGELAKEFYTDIAKPTTVKLGKALETISGLLETVLLPAKGWSEKRGLLYKHNMQRFVSKLETLDSEDVIEIRPELGIPVIERLSYTQSYDISELFINLLASAASSGTVEKAHPTFIGIISSLSVDEARMLSFLAENNYKSVPFIMYKVNDLDSGGYSLSDKYLVIAKEMELIYPNQVEVYMENMVGLGVFSLLEEKHLIGDIERINNEADYYNQMEKGYLEFLGYKEDDVANHDTIVGCYYLSKLGEMFLEVCTTQKEEVESIPNPLSTTAD